MKSRLATLTLPIVGSLLKVPGDNELFASLAPRVFLRMEKLQATGLLGESSLARYRRYIRFDSDAALQKAVSQMRDGREELQLRYDTVEERKGELGESLRNLYRFLNLVGFIALLLGAIGIASAIQVHVRQRLDSVAVLRCLGTTASQAFTIYLIQGAALGLAGVIAGAGLGVLLQQLLPLAFADFIPVEVKFFVDWLAVARAAVLGFVICMLFALLPLLQVRNVSPLAVFRRDLDHLPERDPWLFVVYLGDCGWRRCGSPSRKPKNWRHGVGFAGGLAGALLIAGRGGALRRVERAANHACLVAVRLAARTGQPASTEQSHLAADGFARPRDVPHSHALSRATFAGATIDA